MQCFSQADHEVCSINVRSMESQNQQGVARGHCRLPDRPRVTCKRHKATAERNPDVGNTLHVSELPAQRLTAPHLVERLGPDGTGTSHKERP